MRCVLRCRGTQRAALCSCRHDANVTTATRSPCAAVAALATTLQHTRRDMHTTLPQLHMATHDPHRNNNNSIADARATTAAAATTTTMTRPWPCPECGKSFLCADNLRVHRQARHAVRCVTPAEAQWVALVQHTHTLTAQLRTLRAQRDAVKAAIATLTQRMDKDTATNSSATTSPPSVSRSVFTAALPTRQTMNVSTAELQQWRASHDTVGTGMSQWFGVGVVHGSVHVGSLVGFARSDANADSAKTATASPSVLQFTLETHSHHSRRAGRQRLFRNRTIVRCIALSSQRPLMRVVPGDVVYVHGHYGRHASFDVVSKKMCENVVVEADFVGLLQRSSDTSDETPAAAAAETASVL